MPAPHVLRRIRMALAALVVAGASGIVAVAAAPPASAATACVGVVVDFRNLGGDVRTGCAKGDPGTGLQALTLAGFGYTPRPRDGLICQIDGTPDCTDTTTSTYWSYWYREPGSTTWVYANQGAGTHNPKPGSTEGWVWQDGGRTPPPKIAQDTICPPDPTPDPTGSSGGSEGGSGGGGTGGGTGGGGGSAGGGSGDTGSGGAGSAGTASGRAGPGGGDTPVSGGAAATGTPGRGTTRPAGTSAPGTPAPSGPPAGSTSAVPSADESTVTETAGVASPTDDGGLPPWLGPALGVALVAAIGAGAVVRTRRAQGHRSQ